ncbi:hypothetical protein LTR10_017573 [Elasticomyces elasticus]|nr:hypothetical protein LTR10_017573 [Elasticomyces elasticus]
MSSLFTKSNVLGTHDLNKGNVSIFDSLIASSAFHLRGPPANKHKDWDSLNHIGKINHLKGLKYLQEAIEESSVQVETSYTMVAAILCQISVDIMVGSMTEFFTHLQGAEQFRCLHDSNFTLDSGPVHFPSRRQLAVNASFLTTLAHTTAHHLPQFDIFGAASNQAALFDTPFTTSDTPLEFTYGMSCTTASFIYLTNKYWHCAHVARANGEAIPADLADAIQTLDCLVNSWTPILEPFSSISVEDTKSLAIVRNLAMSFNYAARIYARSCFTLSSLPVNYLDSAELSKLTLISLEAAELEKGGLSQVPSPAVKGASIAWPAFVAACEAPVELRPRWIEYWNVLISYRIGNLRVVWETVKYVWKSIDEGSLSSVGRLQSLPETAEPVSLRTPRWSQVLREGGLSILAI